MSSNFVEVKCVNNLAYDRFDGAPSTITSPQFFDPGHKTMMYSGASIDYVLNKKTLALHNRGQEVVCNISLSPLKGGGALAMRIPYKG